MNKNKPKTQNPKPKTQNPKPKFSTLFQKMSQMSQMSSLIHLLLDIDNETYCCTKKAIKMNTHHQQGGHMLSQINYYFLFLYYTLIMFILLFIIIISNIIPYITIYFTSYYIPAWGIVYISNTITFTLILSSFVIFKNFGKDIMCNCNESLEH